MGTRSEIYVRRKWDDGYFEVVELWKHWDGYPEYMLPFFRRFARFARDCVKEQKHWLTYPPDIASLLIAFDWEEKKKEAKRMRKMGMEIYLKPDIRPRSDIQDARYAYILDLPQEENGDMLITCYKIYGGGGLLERDRDELREKAYLSGHDHLDRVRTVKVKLGD